MKTKTYVAFRVDIRDDTSNSIVEHVAGVDDFEVAEATYRAAWTRWPGTPITLRQCARISVLNPILNARETWGSAISSADQLR